MTASMFYAFARSYPSLMYDGGVPRLRGNRSLETRAVESHRVCACSSAMLPVYPALKFARKGIQVLKVLIIILQLGIG